MSVAAIISFIVGGLLLVLMIAVLLLRRRGHAKAAEAPKRICGECERVMLPNWDVCMFCGWTPKHRIEFLSGPLQGTVVVLDEEVTTLGSVDGNTIVLSDPAVSRKHLGIRRLDENYELADLGSTNGVYVNGHRVAKKVLEIGDLLRVGNTEMLFRRD